MKKAMKKVLAMVMALAVIFTMAMPVFARSAAEIAASQALGAASKDITDAIKYSGKKADGYWSKNLSKKGQQAFVVLCEGIENMDKEIEVPDFDADELKPILNYVQWENPDLFYFNIEKSQRSTIKKNNRNYCKIKPAYDANAKQEISAVNSVVNKIVAGAPKNGSDYDKELYVHDYLTANVVYQKSQHNIYNSLVEGKGNCMGYAYAMQMILEKLGVTCRIQFGTVKGTETHMWNIVTLNGKEYLTDVAWDDPNGSSAQPHHAYFNITKDEMKRDHTPKDAKEWAKCTNTDQDYYRKNNLYFNNYDELVAALPRLTKNNTFEIKMSSNEAVLDAYGKLFNVNGTGPMNQYTNGLGKNTPANGVLRITMTAPKA